MARKNRFWHGFYSNTKTRRPIARRRRAADRLRTASLGLERLEERAMLAAGSLDTTFNPAGTVPGTLIASLGFIETGQSVAVQSDGKILIAGSIESTGGGPISRNFGVARFNADGTLDTSFGTTDSDGVNGLATVDFANHQDTCFDMTLDSMGRIILVGQAATAGGDLGIGVARLTTSGSVDTTFDGDGKAFNQISGVIVVEPRAVALQGDGKIVVAGYSDTTGAASRNFITARYTTGGALDTSTFGGGTGYVITDFDGNRDEANDVAVQSDGKIVVGGRTTDGSNVTRFGLVLYNSDGTVDTSSFGTSGFVRTDVTGLISGPADADTIEAVVIQLDGKIVVAGHTASVDASDAVVARYSTSGVLDTTFNTSGSQPGTLRLNNAEFEEAAALALQSNGDYVVVGHSIDGTNNESSMVFRVSAATGQLDTSFGTSGVTLTNLAGGTITERFRDVAISTDGKIVAGGQYNSSTAADFLLARYETSVVNATIAGAATVDEGATYTLTTTSSDPTTTQWEITWGDGDVEVFVGNPASVIHVYDDGPNSYTISATITTGTGTTTVGNTVAVMVNNVDPTADDATFPVAENSSNGTIVGTVAANDPGTDTLTYSIIGGTGAAAFAIDSMTGEITVLDGSLLDFETTPSLLLDVQVDDGDGGFDTALITIDIINLASISGVVYVDVNQNGQFDANEPGIGGVEIELLDQFGNAVLDESNVPITAVTDSSGFYLFEDLAPGSYQLLEMQPTGVSDGDELFGSLGGTIVANDLMQLTLTDVDAFDYVFAEIGQQLTTGDAAGIGFWQNKHGQQLITQGGTQLANWLTANFSNIFGDALVGASGADVATFYREQLFKQKGKKSAGPAKVDAQFMAVALATYFTSSTLAGQTAAAFGFNVTDTGIGTKIVNVGTSGAAFGVANGSDRTIMQLLLATDSLTDQPDAAAGFAAIYDTDGDGAISTAEANLRTLANSVFGAINEAGGI